MGNPASIIPFATALIGAAPSVIGLFGKKKGGSSSAPRPKAPPLPAPIQDQTSFNRPNSQQAPSFLGFGGNSLSPLQQRTAIATGAVSGSGPAGDPAAGRFFNNSALNSLVDQGGQATGNFTPIEKQYMSQVLGITPLEDTTGSLLSALGRSDFG